jgi:hypothetical protein
MPVLPRRSERLRNKAEKAVEPRRSERLRNKALRESMNRVEAVKFIIDCHKRMDLVFGKASLE